jgi:hypothetical protein
MLREIAIPLKFLIRVFRWKFKGIAPRVGFKNFLGVVVKIKVMFLAFFVVSSFFSSMTIASGSTASGVIERIYVNAGWTQVRVPAIDNAQNNPDGCAKTYYFAIHPSDANYSAFHSTILAAQMSGKKVSFWVNGCGGQNSEYPRVTSVWLFTQ